MVGGRLSMQSHKKEMSVRESTRRSSSDDCSSSDDSGGKYNDKPLATAGQQVVT